MTSLSLSHSVDADEIAFAIAGETQANLHLMAATPLLLKIR